MSERERFYIEAHYHSDVTGDIEQQIAAYEVWKDTYPREWTAPNNLSDLYNTIGRHEDALREAQLARDLEPDRAIPYSNVLTALTSLGRYDDAIATYDEAIGKGLRHYSIYRSRFRAAFVAGDQATMDAEAELVWADQSTGKLVFQLGYIIVFDPDLGDLRYPPATGGP